MQDPFKFKTLWSTRQIISLFNLNDKVQHVANIVYLGTCLNFQANYVGETCRNFEVRQSEHEDPSYNSEPARHVALNKDHEFEWKTPDCMTHWKTRQFKEATHIANIKPSLNNQILKYFELCLFPQEIT